MAEHNPTFECETCGYQDYMGGTEVCPVCDPEGAESQDLCYFINGPLKKCRQDGQDCPHMDDKSWASCEKLEGFDPRRGRDIG